VISERVDDIPVLLAHQERMGIQSLLDEHFSTHGNWQGLSLGRVVQGWLAHILSEGDHRMSHVQGWAEQRLETLQKGLGQPVRGLDFSDDRLEIVLKTLSDDNRWDKFEERLNQHLLRVYDLQPERVRLDSTTASGYGSVTEGGLFQFGHSKNQRPDLPQVKVMLSTLDPLGLPLVTDVLSGERADDPLYVPAVRRVRKGLGKRGLLYVGDCKMAALATRAFVQDGDDYYLCPLSKTQLPLEELDRYLDPVWKGEQELQSIYRDKADGERELIAQGYERSVSLKAVVEGKIVTWTERRLVIRSVKQAQIASLALQKRLAKAHAALTALNERKRGKKRLRDVASARQAVEAIMLRYRVQGLLRVDYEEITHERQVRGYRDRPARVEVTRDIRVTAVVDQAAVEQTLPRLGWRVYATNAPITSLSLTQAVLAYRSQFIIEHGFGRLKGRPLSLTPMYLQRDDHATGLIRLLLIGLRVLTLLEFVVRRRLTQQDSQLAGLYAGNPKRVTARPTAERLLEAFQGITLTIIREPHQTRRHLTPLSPLQRRILDLLDFPVSIFTDLCVHSSKPP
jgi:transposase